MHVVAIVAVNALSGWIWAKAVLALIRARFAGIFLRVEALRAYFEAVVVEEEVARQANFALVCTISKAPIAVEMATRNANRN